jgi:ABC-2 type transport system ATP-binding protein
MDITLNDISAAYRRGTVLHEINWVITSGVTALLGESGAGKTTLLSVLVGLMRPTSGTITATSPVDSGGRALVPRFGFVSQRFSVVAGIRVIDTVSYAAWISGIPRRACEAIATLALCAVGLPDSAGSRVRSLSPGQRRLLGVAAGFVGDPDVLVLDEPMAGLEPAEQTLVREVIAALGATRPVLLSTRRPQEVRPLCCRVAILADGRLIFDGGLEEAEPALSAWRAGGAEPQTGQAPSSVTGIIGVDR